MTSRERLVNLLRLPEQVTAVERGEVPGLLAELEALRAHLWTQLLTADARPDAGKREPDRLLTPKETAAVLGVPVRWLYRHYHQLPFARRLSRKLLRFSEIGVRTWIAQQHGRQGLGFSKMKG
jgi:predicted DNA-binding transcriptional regulator AlpA